MRLYSIQSTVTKLFVEGYLPPRPPPPREPPPPEKPPPLLRPPPEKPPPLEKLLLLRVLPMLLDELPRVLVELLLREGLVYEPRVVVLCDGVEELTLREERTLPCTGAFTVPPRVEPIDEVRPPRVLL